ncbi:hypothetical protein V6N13_014674 [Hibiscus sabdariffa]
MALPIIVALGISLRSLPWNMIFHNRAIFRRRSSPSHAPLAPVVENSRYNPIFLDNDNDNLVPTATNQPSTPSSPRRSTLTPNQVVLPTPSPSIPDPAHSDHDQTSDAPNHSNKTKTQGKSPTLIRKSTLVILGSCDMNIMVRKSSPGASSSIKSFKGRSRSSNLNPAKHLAVVLSESAPPVTLMKMQQQNKNAQHLARTNFAPPPDTYVGCGSRNFIRVTKQYVRDHRPDICVFVETHISHRQAELVINSLGFLNSHRVEAQGFSGGIWLCWFDHIQHLKPLSSTINHPWIVLGDFNATLSLADRIGCSSNSPDQSFQNMVLHCGFQGLGYSGWTLHPDFKRLVRDNWNSHLPITDTIKLFSEASAKWNIEVFGSIQRHKRILMARLRGV